MAQYISDTQYVGQYLTPTSNVFYFEHAVGANAVSGEVTITVTAPNGDTLVGQKTSTSTANPTYSLQRRRFDGAALHPTPDELWTWNSTMTTATPIDGTWTIQINLEGIYLSDKYEAANAYSGTSIAIDLNGKRYELPYSYINGNNTFLWNAHVGPFDAGQPPAGKANEIDAANTTWYVDNYYINSSQPETNQDNALFVLAAANPANDGTPTTSLASLEPRIDTNRADTYVEFAPGGLNGNTEFEIEAPDGSILRMLTTPANGNAETVEPMRFKLDARPDPFMIGRDEYGWATQDDSNNNILNSETCYAGTWKIRLIGPWETADNFAEAPRAQPGFTLAVHGKAFRFDYDSLDGTSTTPEIWWNWHIAPPLLDFTDTINVRGTSAIPNAADVQAQQRQIDPVLSEYPETNSSYSKFIVKDSVQPAPAVNATPYTPTNQSTEPRLGTQSAFITLPALNGTTALGTTVTITAPNGDSIVFTRDAAQAEPPLATVTLQWYQTFPQTFDLRSGALLSGTGGYWNTVNPPTSTITDQTPHLGTWRVAISGDVLRATDFFSVGAANFGPHLELGIAGQTVSANIRSVYTDGFIFNRHLNTSHSSVQLDEHSPMNIALLNENTTWEPVLATSYQKLIINDELDPGVNPPYQGTPTTTTQSEEVLRLDAANNANYIEFAAVDLGGAAATITVTAPNGDSISFVRDSAEFPSTTVPQRFRFDGTYIATGQRYWNTALAPTTTITSTTPYSGTWTIQITGAYGSSDEAEVLAGRPDFKIVIGGLTYNLPYNFIYASPNGYFIWNAHIGSFDAGPILPTAPVPESQVYYRENYYPYTSTHAETSQYASKTIINNEAVPVNTPYQGTPTTSLQSEELLTTRVEPLNNADYIQFAGGSDTSAGTTITITAPNGDSISFTKDTNDFPQTTQPQLFRFDGTFFGPEGRFFNTATAPTTTITDKTPYLGTWRIQITGAYQSSDKISTNNPGSYPDFKIVVGGLSYTLPFGAVNNSPQGYFVWNAHNGSFDAGDVPGSGANTTSAENTQWYTSNYFPTTSEYSQTNETASKTIINDEPPSVDPYQGTPTTSLQSTEPLRVGALDNANNYIEFSSGTIVAPSIVITVTSPNGDSITFNKDVPDADDGYQRFLFDGTYVGTGTQAFNATIPVTNTISETTPYVGTWTISIQASGVYVSSDISETFGQPDFKIVINGLTYELPFSTSYQSPNGYFVWNAHEGSFVTPTPHPALGAGSPTTLLYYQNNYYPLTSTHAETNQTASKTIINDETDVPQFIRDGGVLVSNTVSNTIVIGELAGTPVDAGILTIAGNTATFVDQNVTTNNWIADSVSYTFSIAFGTLVAAGTSVEAGILDFISNSATFVDNYTITSSAIDSGIIESASTSTTVVIGTLVAAGTSVDAGILDFISNSTTFVDGVSFGDVYGFFNGPAVVGISTTEVLDYLLTSSAIDSGIITTASNTTTFVDGAVVIGNVLDVIIDVASTTTTEVIAEVIAETGIRDSGLLESDNFSTVFALAEGLVRDSGIIDFVNNSTTFADGIITDVPIIDSTLIESTTISGLEAIYQLVPSGQFVDSGLIDSNTISTVYADGAALLGENVQDSGILNSDTVSDTIAQIVVITSGAIRPVFDATTSLMEVVDYTLAPGTAVDSGLLESINNTVTFADGIITLGANAIDSGLLESINNTTTFVDGIITLGGNAVDSGLLESINNTTTEVLGYSVTIGGNAIDSGLLESINNTTTEILGYSVTIGGNAIDSGLLESVTTSVVDLTYSFGLADPGIVEMITNSAFAEVEYILSFGGNVIDDSIAESTTVSELLITYTIPGSIIDAIAPDPTQATMIIDQYEITQGALDAGIIESVTTSGMTALPGTFVDSGIITSDTISGAEAIGSTVLGGNTLDPGIIISDTVSGGEVIASTVLGGNTLDAGIITSTTISETTVLGYNIVIGLGNAIDPGVIISTTLSGMSILVDGTSIGNDPCGIKTLVLDTGVVRQTRETDIIAYNVNIYDGSTTAAPEPGHIGSLHFDLNTRLLYVDIGTELRPMKQADPIDIVLP